MWRNTIDQWACQVGVLVVQKTAPKARENDLKLQTAKGFSALESLVQQTHDSGTIRPVGLPRSPFPDHVIVKVSGLLSNRTTAQERSGCRTLSVCRSDLPTPTGIASSFVSMLDVFIEIDFCLSCELN